MLGDCNELIGIHLLDASVKISNRGLWMKHFNHGIETRSDKLKKRAASHAVLITGVLATTFSILSLCILYTAFDEDKRGIVWQIFNSIAVGSLPIGLVSIVFSYFDRMSYVREHVANAIFDSKGYLYFSEDKQRQIKNEIERNLCLKDDDPHNLYSTVQDGIDEIIGDVYVNELIIHIDCQKVNGLFEKKMDETFEYMLPRTKNNLSRKYELSDLLPTHLLMESQIEFCDSQKTSEKCSRCTQLCTRDYKITVDNKNVELQLKKSAPRYKDIVDYKEEYTFKCKNKKESSVVINDKPVKIHLEFVSRVPVSDPIYAFKCKRATRNLTIHFDYDPEKLKVTPIGFGFMDRAMWNENMKISKFPHSIKVRFRNWLLPGNGVVFVIEDREN